MQQNSHFSNLAHIIKTANTIEVEGKSNVYACLKCVQELAIDPEVVCVFSAKGSKCSGCVSKAANCHVVSHLCIVSQSTANSQIPEPLLKLADLFVVMLYNTIPKKQHIGQSAAILSWFLMKTGQINIYH